MTEHDQAHRMTDRPGYVGSRTFAEASGSRRLLVLFADGNASIGTGHVMRSLALAQAWREAGGTAVLVSDCPPALRARVEQAGIVCRPRPAWKGASGTVEPLLAVAEDLAQEFPTTEPRWVALDGYHFDAAFQLGFREAGWRVLVVDDMNHLPRYHADILVNANASAPTFRYATDPGTVMLLGTDHALLRGEFAQHPGRRRQVPAVARRILVTMGGADPHNTTEVVLHAIERVRAEFGVQVRVVLGAANPHRESIAAFSNAHLCDCELLTDVRDMRAQMEWADLAVTAAGSTCLELASMGVPMLAVVIAENQRELAAALEARGIAFGAGSHEDITTTRMTDILNLFLPHPWLRRMMSDAGVASVDGMGCRRIIRSMLQFKLARDQLPSITVRPPVATDVFFMWRLVLQPSAGLPDGHHDLSLLASYVDSYVARLELEPPREYVVELQGRPLGVIRCDTSSRAVFGVVLSFDMAHVRIRLDQAAASLSMQDNMGC